MTVDYAAQGLVVSCKEGKKRFESRDYEGHTVLLCSAYEATRLVKCLTMVEYGVHPRTISWTQIADVSQYFVAMLIRSYTVQRD